MTCKVPRPLMNSIFKMQRNLHNVTRHEFLHLFEIMGDFQMKSNNGTQQGRAPLEFFGTLVGRVFGLSTSAELEHVQKVMVQVETMTAKAASVLQTNAGRISKVIQMQNERVESLRTISVHESNLTSTLYQQMNSISINFELTIEIIGRAFNYVAEQIWNTQNVGEIINALHDTWHFIS